MAWITPIITWTPSPVSNADFNRIEGNTKYLREENKTINGTTTFTSLLTITGSNGTVSVLDGNRIGFSRNSLNYMHMTSAGGTFNVITNGRALAAVNVSMQVSTAGHLLVGQGGTDNGTDLAQFGSDKDISVSMGRLKIDSRYSTYSVLSHYSRTGLLEYNIAMGSLGQLALNGADGTNVEIKIANDNVASFGADSIDMLADQDKTISMGKGKMGYNGLNADRFYMSHYDNMNSTDYGLLFTTNDSYLNAKITLGLRVAGNNIATFGASSINLNKDAAITGSLSTSGIALINGAVDDLTNKLAVQGDAKVNGTFTLNGAFLPDSSPANGAWTASQTIPRGLYNISLDSVLLSSNGDSVRVIDSNGKTVLRRINTGAVASAANSTSGGSFLSDGSATISFSSGASGSVYYQKF